jgi:hypothetical protein
MEELSLDNVQIGFEDTLFESDDTLEETENSSGEKNDKEENKVTEVNPDELFDNDEDEPESVGDEDNNQETRTPPDESTGDSSADFYSSIASVLRKDGVLEYLDDDTLNDIKTAEDFKEMFNNEVEKRISEIDSRVNEALNNGGEPAEIRKYENTLKALDRFTKEYLSDENSEEAAEDRKRLIYQDYLNKGFSQERASKMVQKSLDAGSEIDDALEALEENKKFFTNVYNDYLKELKNEEQKRQEFLQQKEEELQKLVLDTEEPFDGISLDKTTRGKVLDAISKTTIKGDDGKYYTKLQDYQLKNPNEFLYKLGVVFTLTDGFKNIDKLIGKKVKQKTNENIRGLERTLKNQKNYGGTPRYVSNGYDDSKNQNFSRFSLNI